jgi:hypothetical protein
VVDGSEGRYSFSNEGVCALTLTGSLLELPLVSEMSFKKWTELNGFLFETKYYGINVQMVLANVYRSLLSLKHKNLRGLGVKSETLYNPYPQPGQ